MRIRKVRGDATPVSTKFVRSENIRDSPCRIRGFILVFALRRNKPPAGRGRWRSTNCRRWPSNKPGRPSCRNKCRIGRAVHGHRVAQHVHVAILLRQALRERFPFVAASPAAIHAQFAVRRIMQRIARDGHDENRFRLVRVNINRKTEIRRQIAADLAPLLAGIVACATRPSAFA